MTLPTRYRLAPAWTRTAARAVAVAIALSAVLAGATQASAVSPAPGNVVVAVDAPGDLSAVRSRIEREGGQVVEVLPWNAYVVEVAAGGDPEAFASRMRVTAGVRYAEASAPVKLIGPAPASGVSVAAVGPDPTIGEQPHLGLIGALTAWATSTGDGVLVAVVDSGVDYRDSNPELSPAGVKVIKGHNYIANNEEPLDDNGHGTWVAGLIAATANNAEFGAGVAPGARILAIKVLTAAGEGDTVDTARGITEAADKGAKVINVSLAGTDLTGSLPMRDAVDYAYSKGVLVVAAAGNANDLGFGPTVPTYPASFDRVLAVGATTGVLGSEAPWTYSIHGVRWDGRPLPIVAAPGFALHSIRNSGSGLTWSPGTGTSGSTALVSGAAAVVLAKHPSLTPDQVLAQLARTAVDIAPSGPDAYTGYGRIQLDAAVLATPTDGFEPNASPVQALASWRARTAVGGTYYHESEPAGDTDVSFIDMAGGVTYRVWTSGLVRGADTDLRVVGPDGASVLAANDDASAGDPSSNIVFSAPTSGRYFIVNVDSKGRAGAYALNVTAMSAPSLTMGAAPTSVRLPKPFVLSGVLSPGSAGDLVVAEVKKPGSGRWSYSSARVAYSSLPGGGAKWWYRYTPKLRGVYYFRAHYFGSADRSAAYSRTMGVRVR